MTFFKKITGLAAAILLIAAMTGFGSETGLKMLHGHVPKILSRLTPLGILPATNQLSLAIGLPLRNQAALDVFLQQLYDPRSPNFRKYLTPAEFTARFGPTESDYAAVKNFAQTNGLTISGTHGNRLLLDVTGPVSAIQKAFHITLRTYRHPSENRNFFAPDAEPSVNSQLPIADISGLDNFSRPHPNFHRRATTAAPRIGSGSGGTYFGNDFRTAYVPGTTLTGAGQTVGLVQFDGFYSNDIASYASAAGLTNIPILTVLIDGFSGTPTGGDGNTEVSLDIEMAMSMAPGLNSIVVFEGNINNFIPNHVLTAMVESNTVKNLSSSWGWSGGPSATTDTLFQEMAAQGQTYFNASGDSDAFPAGYVDNPNDVAAPSSSPYITQVGGTTLTTAPANSSYSSETVWNWGYDSNAGAYVGSSGGVSSYYSIPFWQQGINSFQSNGGSTTQRNIPDVALLGDNVLVDYGNGSSETVGGTSCAAPLWAGFMALVNQQAAANSQSPVGFINPAIYELANESLYNSVFHDVTTGNNTSTSSPNAFFAVPGYDLCTGLGTPNGTNLINALLNPDPLIVATNYGFTTTNPGNGIFNVTSQTFFLTNAAASPLTWSLINTSAWLDVSRNGDSLAAGAGDSVIVSLDPAATNFSAGTYTTTLWFSNVTSRVGHSRLFTLNVNDPLVISPTNNIYFVGPPGGPFAPAAQQIILTNLRSNTLNWTLNNTSMWFNISLAGGSISSGTNSTVTITLTPAVTNLVNGIYPATFTVTDLDSGFVQTITDSVLVGQSLVQNGGFETGDFTDWTLSGSSSDNFVDDGNFITPHSGNYYAALGQSGSLAYLSQTLPTIVGQKYLLSFWLDNPLAGSSGRHGNPNQFTVSWNGSALYNQINLGEFTWNNFQYVVTATTTNTVLQFGGRDDNYFLGLDDVSVIPGFAPTISTQPTNLVILSGSNAAFTATANGSTPLVYIWRQNGINLTDGSGVSGSATSNLTLTAITTNSAGNYTLFVTNIFGMVTSSVATLTVVLPPSIAGVAANAYGSVTLNLAGSPGINYILETTTNLISPSWLPVATNLIGTNGFWQFNTPATNSPWQFYRLEYSQ
jgi:hypothetical protein